jgi:acyl carrier protein
MACANRVAGTALVLPPDGDLPLDAFRFDSFSLFAFLLELERECQVKFDEMVLDSEQLRSIRLTAAPIAGRRGESRAQP